MLDTKLQGRNIICGSGSPRRQHLLHELGLEFTVRLAPVEENFPPDLIGGEIPVFLSKLKAEALLPTLKENDLLITADTIVWLHEKAVNKPADAGEARSMLRELSGRMHQVFTGVTLTGIGKSVSFYAETKVWFRELSDEEIDYYVRTCMPLDKAGAYGAQEWIGYVGVRKIEGTYFNVMGLPLAELYDELMRW